MAMRRRAGSFLTLLQGDPVAVRRRVRRLHRHLGSDHAQDRLMLNGPQDEGLNAHDAPSYCRTANAPQPTGRRAVTQEMRTKATQSTVADYLNRVRALLRVLLRIHR